MRRHFTQWIVLLIGLLASSLTAHSAHAAEEETVHAIRAAWKQRSTDFKSIDCQCDIESKGLADERRLPHGRTLAKNDGDDAVILKSTLTYKTAGEKQMWSMEREEWDFATNAKSLIPQISTQVFDGVENKGFTGKGQIILGQVTKTNQPDDMLTVFAQLEAFYLSIAPVAYLERRAYKPYEIQVVNAHAQQDGIECIELSIPRGPNKWLASMWVDPARDYVPIRFTEKLDGEIASDLSINYASDPAIGWRVAGWSRSSHKGGNIYTGLVSHCSINQPIDDDAFDLEFPVASQVSVHRGENVSYFVVTAAGTHRSIPESEFGHFDNSLAGSSRDLVNGSSARAIEQVHIPGPYDDTADGSKQIADALEIAKASNKRVLLQFGANWCGWCKRLDSLFKTDQKISEKLKANYVVTLIDVNEGHNKEVDAEYGTPTKHGLPVLVVLDADGKQLVTKDTGELEEDDHHSPDKVLEFLNEWTPKR